MPSLQTWGFNKSDKSERIDALQKDIDRINKKLTLLFKADESNAEALRSTDFALTLRIKHVNNETLAEVHGVANDLARI